MTFKEKPISKLYAFALAAVFAVALAGCGGGGTATAPDPPTMPGTTPQEMCEGDGGRYNADGSCTSAADLAAERMAAATKAAKTKTTAIGAEAKQTSDAGLGGSGVTATDQAAGAYNLAISRDRAGTMVTVTVEGATDDDDEKFMQAADLMDGRTMHTRTMEADDDGNVMEEVVIVGTDIEAPKATAFAMVEGQKLDVSTDKTNDTPTQTNEALAITPENFKMVENATGISATGATTVSYPAGVADAEDTAADESRPAFSTPATFNGAPGTLMCNGDPENDCTVTFDSDGDISNMEDWVFTPDAGATSDVPDSDYLYYGFWLKKTTDKDGAVTYNEVETFAGSSIPQSTSLGKVTGSATYAGGAVGVYVKDVYDSTGQIDTSTSGHFKADVSLTAYFGQTIDDPSTLNVNEGGQIAPILLNTISGSISNFMLSGGEANEWSANLARGAIKSDGAASGVANGGGAAGSYSATFHGPTETDDNTQPHSVVGEFNANFSDGTVAGAFGARKQ